jgi:hypothetical protein
MSKKTYVDEKGYRRFKDSGKLVSRWAAEKKVGGKIGKGRVVHHIDRNRQNNSRDNLWIMSRSEHGKHHAKERMGAQSGRWLVRLLNRLLRG